MITQSKEQQIQDIHVEYLLLDNQNPRLSSVGQTATQGALLKELYLRYDLDDLILSLSENGYFSEEPLIAVESKSKESDKASGKKEKLFVVVEGNRRLAALKILLFDADRRTVGAKNVPEPSPDILRKLNPVPVKVYHSRLEITPYMGVRHIVGVKPWDALAKARYIERLAKEGDTIGEIKKKVGIGRGDVVQRWLLALYVLTQANDVADEHWREADKDFSFSFIYTSLGYQGVRKYLGIDADAFKSPKPNPVPLAGQKNLLEHMRDLYGAPDRPELRKVKESREIQKLAAVYDTPGALDLLRAGAPLAEAYARSMGEAAELVELVRTASYKLDQANALAPHHKKNSEARKFAKRCCDSAKYLYDNLED